MRVKHIGIVACSSEGAALCYRTICLEGEKYLGPYVHPEITMHTHSFSEYVKYIKSNDWKGVAKLMLSSAEKVAKAGADFIICPDNTIHQAFDLVVKRSPIPWLHIAEEVALEALSHEYKCVGILGTIYLMRSQVYPEKLKAVGIEYMLPETHEQERINRIIFEELVKGIISEKSRNYFVEVIKKLKGKGCDAVVLGCTEIPLIVTPEVSPLPTLDSTRILARAALKKALEE
ncbi:aspartate racemase [Candidatus Bathyarchaeota archaeon]|nr:MAG: aspartate racemase [Candidatus Bathyarchaeota archaeon]